MRKKVLAAAAFLAMVTGGFGCGGGETAADRAQTEVDQIKASQDQGRPLSRKEQEMLQNQ